MPSDRFHSGPTLRDLEYYRNEFLLLTDIPCSIYRATEENDGAGGITKTWNKIADTYMRMIPSTHRPSTEAELKSKDAVRNITFWTFRFPYGTDIQEKDKVIQTPYEYEVVGIFSNRSSMVTLRVTMVRLL
jgi:hypothetical protein